MPAFLTTGTPPDPPPEDGWTVFTPTLTGGHTLLSQQEGSAYSGAGTRAVYVSRSGSDSNTGTQAQPVKTLSQGISLIRDGHPDYLFLKCDDIWTDEYLNGGKSGISSTEPILITSYGSGARPLLKVHQVGGVDTTISGWNNTAIVDIEAYAYTSDPSSPDYDGNNTNLNGFGFTNSFDWLLIEGCKFSWFNGNYCDRTFDTNSIFLVRRNIVHDDYSSGMYCQGVGHPTLEENFWYSNGGTSVDDRSIFTRNVYMSSETGHKNGAIVATGEMSFRSASEGHQFRNGGTITESLFVGNSCGFDYGHQVGEGALLTTGGGATDCVILLSNDIDPSDPRGTGIAILNTTGATFTNVIVAHLDQPPPNFNSVAFFIDGESSANALVNCIAFAWNGEFGALRDDPGDTTLTNFQIDVNGDNVEHSYPAPNRTIASYCTANGISPASEAGFVAATKAQRKGSWSDLLMAASVNDYIRAGFGR